MFIKDIMGKLVAATKTRKDSNRIFDETEKHPLK